MKTKEELIRIYSAYLPYGLRFQTVIGWEKKIETLESFDIDYLDGRLVLNSNPYFEAKNVKPILYDLSYLTKEIEHEEKMITPSKEILKHIGVPGDYFEIKEGYVLIRRNGMVKHKIIWAGELADDCMVWVYQKLIEWHFNVFNLPEGEFINKAILKEKSC